MDIYITVGGTTDGDFDIVSAHTDLEQAKADLVQDLKKQMEEDPETFPDGWAFKWEPFWLGDDTICLDWFHSWFRIKRVTLVSNPQLPLSQLPL